MKKLGIFAVALISLITISILSLSNVKASHLPASGSLVPNGYIVVFKKTVTNSSTISHQLAHTYNLQTKYIYQGSINGFAATIPQTALSAIKADPRVLFITPDRYVTIEAKKIQSPTPVPTTSPSASPTSSPTPTPTPTTKPGHNPKPTPTPTPTSTPTPTPSSQIIPTGVSRIGINSTNTGSGVSVAVIDTGVDMSHPDLTGAIVASYNCIDPTQPATDGVGHGTHVAGIIAAQNNSFGVVGAASGAKIADVKVFDDTGAGTWSSVICGINWVTNNAASYNIKVANMSISGSGSSDNDCGLLNQDALHQAICNSTAAGITYVVAAGNDDHDASLNIPAAYDDTVITVSALADSDGQPGGLGAQTSYGADDTFASFSNYGSVVDLGAPGVDIYSTYNNDSYATLSGTSMAAPHVSAAAALYIYSHPGSSWQQVKDGLESVAEPLNQGHTDPSGLHPEPVVRENSL